MKKIGINVTVPDPTPAKLKSVAQSLRGHGATVKSILDAIGVIRASVDADKLPALQRLPGCVVELDQSVQLPPPDADVQ